MVFYRSAAADFPNDFPNDTAADTGRGVWCRLVISRGRLLQVHGTWGANILIRKSSMLGSRCRPSARVRPRYSAVHIESLQ